MKRQIHIKSDSIAHTNYIQKPLYPSDVGAYELVFEPQAGDIAGAVFTVSAKRADGVVVTDVGSVTDGVCRYTLKSNMYSVPGELRILASLAKDGTVLTDCEVIAQVAEGHDAPDLAGEDRVPALSALIAQAAGAVSACSDAASRVPETPIVDDAPADGYMYVREAGGWQKAPVYKIASDELDSANQNGIYIVTTNLGAGNGYNEDVMLSRRYHDPNGGPYYEVYQYMFGEDGAKVRRLEFFGDYLHSAGEWASLCIDDAPADGAVYARANNSWQKQHTQGTIAFYGYFAFDNVYVSGKANSPPLISYGERSYLMPDFSYDGIYEAGFNSSTYNCDSVILHGDIVSLQDIELPGVDRVKCHSCYGLKSMDFTDSDLMIVDVSEAPNLTELILRGSTRLFFLELPKFADTPTGDSGFKTLDLANTELDIYHQEYSQDWQEIIDSLPTRSAASKGTLYISSGGLVDEISSSLGQKHWQVQVVQ